MAEGGRGSQPNPGISPYRWIDRKLVPVVKGLINNCDGLDGQPDSGIGRVWVGSGGGGGALMRVVIGTGTSQTSYTSCKASLTSAACHCKLGFTAVTAFHMATCDKMCLAL